MPQLLGLGAIGLAARERDQAHVRVLLRPALRHDVEEVEQQPVARCGSRRTCRGPAGGSAGSPRRARRSPCGRCRSRRRSARRAGARPGSPRRASTRRSRARRASALELLYSGGRAGRRASGMPGMRRRRGRSWRRGSLQCSPLRASDANDIDDIVDFGCAPALRFGSFPAPRTSVARARRAAILRRSPDDSLRAARPGRLGRRRRRRGRQGRHDADRPRSSTRTGRSRSSARRTSRSATRSR